MRLAGSPPCMMSFQVVPTHETEKCGLLLKIPGGRAGPHAGAVTVHVFLYAGL